MYEKRFGFHRKPFQSVLTDQDYFESTSYQEIKPTILHAVRSDLGVAILTGPAGIGKTVTLEHFRQMLESDSQVIVFRGGTVRSADELLYLLHRRLVNPKPDPDSEAMNARRRTVQRWEVVERLQRVSDFWGPVVLLLDDAHLAGTDVFSELRDLLEETAGGRRLIRLLVAGPLLLEEVLAEQSMIDFAQRIRTHVFLQPLRSTESVEYLYQQIRNSGADPSAIFDRQAIERIVAAADGVPRCLNLLADESLMVCENDDQTRVNVEVVNTALTRLQHLPYSWNVSLFGSDSETDQVASRDSFEIGAEAGGKSRVGSSAIVASNGVIEIGCSNSLDGGAPSISDNAIEIGAPCDVVKCEWVADDQMPSATGSLWESEEQLSVTIDVIDEPVVIDAANERVDDFESVPSDDLAGLSDFEPIEVCEVTIEEFLSEDVVAVAPMAANPERSSSQAVADSCSDSDVSRWNGMFAPVSFAHSSLEVEEVAGTNSTPVALSGRDLGAGTTDESIAEASSISGGADLEHHLVLATGVPQDSPSVLTESGESVSRDAVGSGLSTPNGNVSEENENSRLLSNFTPWRPPGEWHTASVAVWEISRHPAKTLRADAVNVNTSSRSEKANRTPVFDRYTWCELGRQVTSESARNPVVHDGFQPSAEWPPNTEGLAPASSYLIQEMDKDYAELLADLGILTGFSTHVGFGASDADESVRKTFANPDESIAHIQSLLLEEAAPGFDESEATAQHDNTEENDEGAERTQSSSGAVVSSSENGSENIEAHDCDVHDCDVEEGVIMTQGPAGQVEATDAATLEAVEGVIESVQPGNGQMFTLPIDIDELDLNQPVSTKTESYSSETGSLSVSPEHSAACESKDQDVKGSRAIGLASSIGAGRGPNSRTHLMLVKPEHDEELQENQYSPQLLRQARARVVTVPAGLGQLKLAAGAESASADDQGSQLSLDQRSAHLSVAAESDCKATESEKTSSGFSNLFTRLRNMTSR